MSASVRSAGKRPLRQDMEIVSVQDGQVAGVEIRALNDVDLTDVEAWRLSVAAERFQTGRTDELRLPPPPNRSRTQPELQGRLTTLLDRFESGDASLGLPNENRARAVELMLGTLSSLARVQMQIDRARKSDRRAE